MFENFETDMLVMQFENADNGPVKEAIRAELARRAQNNNSVSIEHLFRISRIQNHAITVFLFPGTQAYEIVGRHVTIDLVLSQDEIARLIANIQNNPPISTFGHFNIRVIARGDLTEDKIRQIEATGIDTSEIYDIMHVN